MNKADEKHHFFRCSNCNAPLIDIWVQHPNFDMAWKFVVECPHCGDKSYEQDVQGSFIIGSTEESSEYTALDSFDIDNDPIIVKTKKVKQYERK